MNDMRNNLEALLRGPLCSNPCGAFTRVVLYGAGGCGRRVSREFQERGVEVVAFLDVRAPGSEAATLIDGIPCYAPASLEACRLAAEGVVVLITVFNNSASNPEEILQLLREVGFKAVFSQYEVRGFLGGEEFWLGPRETLQGCLEEILRAFDLLADERSQRIFSDHIAFRMTYHPGSLSQPDLDDQYAPEGISLREPMRLVDGGAFDGDTLRFFLERGYIVEGFAGFEPDLENFEKLSEVARRRQREIKDLVLMPAGLGRETEILRFQSGKGIASRLSNDGDLVVPVVALDEVLPTFSPTYIKLDIEGAEAAALLGAESVIRESKPDLAVCLYHRPADLWELPILMHALLPEHKLRIRCHRYHGFELVAYLTKE